MFHSKEDKEREEGPNKFCWSATKNRLVIFLIWAGKLSIKMIGIITTDTYVIDIKRKWRKKINFREKVARFFEPVLFLPR